MLDAMVRVVVVVAAALAALAPGADPVGADQAKPLAGAPKPEAAPAERSDERTDEAAAATIPGLAGTPDLVAVDARGGHAVAVGTEASFYVLDRRAGAWVKADPPTSVEVGAVAVVSRRDVWALPVGGQFLHFDGRAWSSPPGSTTRTFYGLAMADRRRGAAVGHGGRIVHLVQQGWYPIHTSPTRANLRAVARVGSGGRERFVAVGDGGVAVALRGVGRSIAADLEITGTETDLVAVTACPGARAEAVAAGAEVRVRRRDGTWTGLPAPPAPLRALALRCRAGAAAAVIGLAADRLLVLDVAAGTWTETPVPAATSLRDLTWLDRRHLLLVGDAGFSTILPAP
jgi:hypothetical protein